MSTITQSPITHIPSLPIAFYNSTSRAHNTCNAPLATWLALAAADWRQRWVVVRWVARPATRCPTFENAHRPTDTHTTQKGLRAPGHRKFMCASRGCCSASRGMFVAHCAGATASYGGQGSSAATPAR
jgi:hypothetical protein